MILFSFYWCDTKRTYEIFGVGEAILAIYSHLKRFDYNKSFHCYYQGKEYDLESGLR